ncbi:MAG: vWA domain-containing protein, partial [Bacteroidota bacterium]|nr:vWA domain-containing protein [Bacteroidota bacterium]
MFQYVAVTAIEDAEFALAEVAYTPKATEVDRFTYQMIDSDGDTSSADLRVAHTNATDETAVDDMTQVDEGGVLESSGNLLDNDSGLIDEEVVSITSDGVVYEANDDGVIVVDNAMSHLEVQSDGEYIYTLKNNTTEGVDDKIRFDYTLSNSSTASLTVSVVDDMPVIMNNPVEVSLESGSTEAQSYNITLVIDRSGSMSVGLNPMDIFGASRMDATKDAIGTIVEQYSKLGELNINIIDFSESVAGSGWLMNDENGVKDYLNFIEPNGEAHYDDAIKAVINSDEVPEADNNILYFMSDGAPSAGHHLDDDLQAEWNEYRDNSFDAVYAVASGGSWVNTNFDMESSLDAITGNSDNSFMIHSVSDLESTLLTTIDSDKKVSGDLIDNSDNAMFNFGADGGYISSIVIDSKEYSYNPKEGDTITVTTPQGAILTLDFKSGEYSYQANLSTIQSGEKEAITVMGVDGDGDKVQSQLLINLDTEAVKDTSGDIIITNITEGAFEIPAFTLLANDNPSVVSGFNDTKTVDMELEYDDSGMFLVDPTKDFISDFGSEMTTFDKEREDLAISREDFGYVSDGDSVKDATMPTVQINGELAEDDADMMSLNLEEGEWLILDVDNGYNGDEDDSVDTTLTLYTKDSDGNLVAVMMNEESKIVSGGSGSTYKNDPFLSYQVKEDAEYFVKVSNSGTENEGRYTLMISIVPALDEMKFEYETQEGEGSVVNFMRTALDTLHGSEKSEILLADDEDTIMFADGGDDTL